MSEYEKQLLSMYLVNQGLRLDREFLDAKRLWDTRQTYAACMALLGALQRKQDFDKFQHDLCALLQI